LTSAGSVSARLACGERKTGECRHSGSQRPVVDVTYFERLKDDPETPCRGERGAVRFSYRTVPRYLDNTTFAQLVADGWIGSSGTGTSLIKEQIEASRAGQREPILAFASGDMPKARRTRERLRS
jgi:hypothetical protein